MTKTHEIDLGGPRLMVHELGAETPGVPIVVALHGITANGLSFAGLGEALGHRARLWAPDLRGRACSRTVGPPYGLGRHADDAIAVLEATGQQRSVLIGHSMGAFVAALAASRRPDLVAGLLLVDGGLAFPLPVTASEQDVDAILQAVIGPAMTRLSMTFESPDDYRQFWAPHPAVGPTLAGPRGEAVQTYLDHDLVPDGERYRSSCVLESVRSDGAGTLTDAETHAAPVRAVEAGVPTTLVWAARGLADEPQGLYDADRLAALSLPDRLRTVAAPDVNHYTVLFEPPGLSVVTEQLSALLDGSQV